MCTILLYLKKMILISNNTNNKYTDQLLDDYGIKKTYIKIKENSSSDLKNTGTQQVVVQYLIKNIIINICKICLYKIYM